MVYLRTGVEYLRRVVMVEGGEEGDGGLRE